MQEYTSMSIASQYTDPNGFVSWRSQESYEMYMIYKHLTLSPFEMQEDHQFSMIL